MPIKDTGSLISSLRPEQNPTRERLGCHTREQSLSQPKTRSKMPFATLEKDS